MRVRAISTSQRDNHGDTKEDIPPRHPGRPLAVSLSDGRRVYITHPIKGLHRQLRNVTENRSGFPSIHSALRLVTLVLRDINGHNHSRTGAITRAPRIRIGAAS